MIKINKKDGIITISGHANYRDTNDIVCASISSIMYTTVNAILNFDDKAIEFTDDSNKCIIKTISNDDITTKLIDNMMMLFDSIRSDYPKNIEIIKED